MTTTLALPSRYSAQIAKSLEGQKKPVVVWLEFQDCSGNSQSVLRASHPTVAQIAPIRLAFR